MRAQTLAAELIGYFEEEVADFLGSRGVPEVDAKKAGRDFASLLSERFGGQLIYIPKDVRRKRQERDAQILAEFTGRNQTELSRRHGVGLAQVYKIIQTAYAAKRNPG